MHRSLFVKCRQNRIKLVIRTEQYQVDDSSDNGTGYVKIKVADGDVVDVSPIYVYTVVEHVANRSRNKCSTKFCSLTRTFQWHRPSSTCDLRVTCSNLSSNICQNFGVILKGREDQAICESSQIVSTRLRTGESALLEIWWTRCSH